MSGAPGSHLGAGERTEGRIPPPSSPCQNREGGQRGTADEPEPGTSAASVPQGPARQEGAGTSGGDSPTIPAPCKVRHSSPGARLLTVREVAARLSVCTATVYSLCSRGLLRFIRVSGALRIDPAGVEAFIAAGGSSPSQG
ncbi:MAG TPA: helix-turn-helix domain-containing protein [Archangium sp.]|uniref:helix-turn-helix domain-containing protein n=1 Tax=Archangium sp. TaxID=1872627 RepID=UPI002E378E6D|nr:helix-turn-helix domain-containing protein [Archangium sp.]HEX5746825.1 helix-turn-helix domain-containing protein [Archangium sp.]